MYVCLHTNNDAYIVYIYIWHICLFAHWPLDSLMCQAGFLPPSPAHPLAGHPPKRCTVHLETVWAPNTAPNETASQKRRLSVSFWVVVSNIFYFHPYLGKWSNLTNIFQMGWNHQPVFFWLQDIRQNRWWQRVVVHRYDLSKLEGFTKVRSQALSVELVNSESRTCCCGSC